MAERTAFTLPDGTRLTKGHIYAQVKRALKETDVRKFKFHDLGNTALTAWARHGIPVDVAMKASGHGSVQMHQRCVDLQVADVPALSVPRKLVNKLVNRKG